MFIFLDYHETQPMKIDENTASFMKENLVKDLLVNMDSLKIDLFKSNLILFDGCFDLEFYPA